jgi:hypothetical protein
MFEQPVFRFRTKEELAAMNYFERRRYYQQLSETLARCKAELELLDLYRRTTKPYQSVKSPD